MFDDPKKDLKRLDEALRAAQAEDPDDADWLEDARELVEREFETEGETVYYDDEEDDETYSVPVPKKKKRLGGLVFLLILELLGIAAVGCWWLLWK